MEILQENQYYRVILERVGALNHIELHERATGLTQTITHDPEVMSSNTMESLRKDYARIAPEKIAKCFDRWGVKKIKVYKEGV